jgi:TDG/mug DNA glycosylase family protein
VRRKPGFVAFNGKAAAAVFYDKRTDQLEYGLQPAVDGLPPVLVLPSTSGSARKYWDISYWRQFMEFLRREDAASATLLTGSQESRAVPNVI